MTSSVIWYKALISFVFEKGHYVLVIKHDALSAYMRKYLFLS